MLRIDIPEKEPKTNESPLLYVGAERRKRFRKIAKDYRMPMVDVFDKVLEALELNLAEREENQAPQ